MKQGIWVGIGLAGMTGLVAILVAVGLHLQAADEPKAPVTFGSLTDGLRRHDGLFTLYTDEDANRVLMTLPPPDPQTGVSAEVIHVSYLRSGLGSNPVGLDRGRGGDPQILRFEVLGGKVHAVALNTRFVARSADPLERRATEESFARSVVWTTDIVARADDGRLLIDLKGLLALDTVGVAARLSERGQGTFSLDAGRSAPYARETLAFPDNVEFEAQLTFSGKKPGSEVRATAPVPEALTFTMHHSLVRLPDDGFAQRRSDPRVGAVALPIADYAAGLDEAIERRVVLRHRLEKVNPDAERSPVKEPIVFYLDPGAPEPVRSALLEGARWWAAGFEAAGFEDAYRVELLPDGAHPLDARYNVIQWVHRQTRGWSYGSPIYDPRTGEIIKAVITLGSLRVRHDRRIFEGLLDAERTGKGGADDPVEIALSRLRQLSAHEVGHGLGFAHNMAASADNRASVMDYPAPWVQVTQAGDLDFSQAYGVGIGPWDVLTLRYVYEDLGTGTDEEAGLDVIAREAVETRLFVTDPHSRPVSGAHPRGSVWDNGSDAVEELRQVMAVRQVALADFGLANLPEGAPVSELREILVPIYLFHRYQVAAAAKFVGGMTFYYAVKGDGAEAMSPVPPDDQRRALNTLTATLEPAFLALPDALSRVLGPQHQSWFDSRYDRDDFRSDAFPLFDEAQAARVAAGMTFDALLNRERMMRLAHFHRSDPQFPSAGEVLETIGQTVLAEDPAADGHPLREVVIRRYVSGLIGLAGTAEPGLAAIVEGYLEGLSGRLEGHPVLPPHQAQALRRQIRRFLDRPVVAVASVDTHPPTPPGSPIGGLMACDSCWFCDLPIR